jgi:hypothetical protein
MGLVDLTQNLENFKWTNYSGIGDSQSPQSFGDGHSATVVSGKKEFVRPDPIALEKMESKFGPRSSEVDYMDAEKRGRGFIPPGDPPEGFKTNMETSFIAPENQLAKTPISYTIAGMNSALIYGIVTEKSLNIEPRAEGAWGNSELPISTYVSYYPREEDTFSTLVDSSHIIERKPTPLVVPGIPIENQGSVQRYLPKTYSSIKQQVGYIHRYGNPPISVARPFDRNLTEAPFEFIGRTQFFNDFLPTTEVTTTTIGTGSPYFATGTTTIDANGNVATLEHRTSELEEFYRGQVKGLTIGQTLDPRANSAEPFIVRKIGDRWGLDDPEKVFGKYLGKVAGFVDGLSSEFFRDGISSQIDRSFADATRTSRFLLSQRGMFFLMKQGILQSLSPTLETKIYNPFSLASIVPTVHLTRHLGGFKYEDVISGENFVSAVKDKLPKFVVSLLEGKEPVFGGRFKDSTSLLKFGGLNFPGRIKFQALDAIGGNEIEAFGIKATPPKIPMALETRLLLGNPNKYLFPFSSAPVSISRGIPSFSGGLDLAAKDADRLERDSITFGRNKGISLGGLKEALIDRYTSLAYGQLQKGYQYYKDGKIQKPDLSKISKESLVASGQAVVDKIGKGFSAIKTVARDEVGAFKERQKKQLSALEKSKGIGGVTNRHELGLMESKDETLGLVKIDSSGKLANDLADKINLVPYGGSKDDDSFNDTDADFIPFKFRDIVNGKWIIFRAILSGINDSVSPDWGDTRFVGRPDKVFVYKGVDRTISFDFDIYPKTKQELPVLWEKINYLMGLCYPSWTNDRIVAPFIELTIGNLYEKTPGFLASLSIASQDNSTWEIESGMQLPKHIKATCTFRYIGKYKQSTIGKHFELPWLELNATSGELFDKNPMEDAEATYPIRNAVHETLYSEISDESFAKNIETKKPQNIFAEQASRLAGFG